MRSGSSGSSTTANSAKIEAADKHQRAGAEFGGDRLGVREGVADLAQRHQAKRRRQVERRSQTACSGVFADGMRPPVGTFELGSL